MIYGANFAKQAESEKYNKLKYSQVDCQAYVELVLKDCGIRQANGAVYNWRGSNDMWRNALSWKGTIAEARLNFGGEIPLGALVFMVANDGGEIARGYHDNQGNASHVGILVSQTKTRDSTKGTGRDGVAYRPLKDWTHIGLLKCIDYNNRNHNIISLDGEVLKGVINTMRQELIKLEGILNNDNK